MYRVLTILALVQGIFAAEIGLMDGSYSEPVNKESFDVFRNTELFPYRFHNVGRRHEPSRSRPKRKATDNLNWDIPDSLANCWFSQDHNDFCLVAKAVIMVFAVIGFVGVLLLIVCICWRSFGYHAYGYTETECRSSDCICGQDSA